MLDFLNCSVLKVEGIQKYNFVDLSGRMLLILELVCFYILENCLKT